MRCPEVADEDLAAVEFNHRIVIERDHLAVYDLYSTSANGMPASCFSSLTDAFS